jgi:hypothetical protein
MVTDVERDWLVTETANLVEETGLDRYVAAALVEPTDRWFPDDWHADDTGVARLAKRVFGHAGLADVSITTELADSDDKKGITAEVHDDNVQLHLLVDPAYLTDPLTAVAELAHLAAYIFRARHDLCVSDDEEERRLIDLTAVYLGFGIIMTNAAYRYRASGEMQGNVAITRWSHDEQGALRANVMAYALAMQLVTRSASAAELRGVRRQLETNQAEAFEAACGELDSDELVAALELPPRSEWPARREPPAAPTSKRPRLWQKQPQIPTAVVKNRNFLGHNKDQPVLRLEQSRTIELGFGALIVSGFASIPLLVTGSGVAAAITWVGATVVGFVGGHRIRRDICVGRGCGAKLPRDVERCPRCAGTIVGRMLAKENLLEAEERLGINQDGLDIDVGEASEGSGSSVELPAARIARDARVGRGATDTRIR